MKWFVMFVLCWMQQAWAQSLDCKLNARALADNVYIVAGANGDFMPANGCNIINTGFIATGAGVLVISTGPSKLYGEQLRALIERTTREPVVQVLHLNLHPDDFLGNQAFADVPRRATAATRTGMQRESKSSEDNLYRLCGDWMAGTQALLPQQDFAPGPLRIGTREFELRELAGHTASERDHLLWLDQSFARWAGEGADVNDVLRAPMAPAARWYGRLTID